MASSFSIAPSRYAADPEAALHEEIRSHTGCDMETSTIMRCIERLGFDPDIRRYEMTPTTKKLGHRGSAPVTWSVRAVRV
ncbi:MAG: hypothetical protein KY464_04400 [Gemmatimonadetes bacterium]|nr:hypothetical protein [Gemmatimonadota bacterium]